MRHGRNAAPLLGVLLLLLSGTPAPADDLDLLAPAPNRFGGQLKLLGLLYDLGDLVPEAGDAEWSLLGALRLTAEGDPQPWLAYELHVRVEQDLYSEPFVGGLGGITESTTVLFRGLGGSATWRETETSRLWAEVDYANLRFTTGSTDVVVGRQAVSFGRSFFWNPVDWLSSFTATEIDREYKGGVDVVRLSHAIGRFSGVEALYAYGDGGDRDSSAVIGRAYANWRGWDVEILGGSVWIDDRAGAAFAGEIKGAGVRGELSWQRPRLGDEADFWRASLEADYRWPSSLQLMAELHHNGWGSGDPADYAALFAADRLRTGQVTNVGRNYAAAQLSYELTPLLLGACAMLGNLDDGSGMVNPSISYSLGDEARLDAGALLPWGKGPRGDVLRSEYGSYATTLWVQLRWAF